jgi:hypothetical protein
MLSAEPAILLHFKTVGIVLLVLHRVVVSLLALVAAKRDLYAHFGTSLKYLPPCITAVYEKFSWCETTLHRPRLKMGVKRYPLFHR